MMAKLFKLFSFVLIISMLTGACGTHSSPMIQPSAVIIPSAQPPENNPPATATRPSPSEEEAGLEALDFDEFVEQSYRRLLSRDPETVLELGLSQEYGTPTDQLTNISDEYIRQTQILESETLTLLQQFNRSTLSSEQQLTYDIYTWYLEDRVRGQAFMYNDYPINPTIFSLHLDLLQFFTDLRPVTNLQEAQDYINSLSQLDTKFEQLIDGLKRREENGVILPKFLIGWIIGDLSDIATGNARSSPYYAAFEAKVNALSNVSETDKQSLLTSVEEVVNSAVIPAYQALVKYLEHLQSIASNDAGVWKFPNGEAYYSYALRHYTSTDLAAEQIHELGLLELERIHAEMRAIFDQLGYPQDESLPELYSRLVDDSGAYTGAAIVQGYEDIITTASQNLGDAFDLLPGIGVIVVGGPSGGYYTAPAVDGSRPGIFYAQNTGSQPKFSMPSLAYHEAIPGHHFQIAISQQLDLPSLRRDSNFVAYVEGWALYAERLAAELGLYENDPYGDLGRLQAEAFRAARLVVDTGLHSKRWTFDQAVDFMVENTGKPEYAMQGEVSRYITLPGQATAYYIGYARILEVRQRAMDAMGDQFDLKEFHNLLLGSGAMPLDILEQVINSYIQSKASGG